MTTADVYGVLRAASFQIALSTENIEQVVSRPEILPIPDPGVYCSGALRRGDQLIPLISLATLLSPGSSVQEPAELALIVRTENRLLALSIDAIVKVARPGTLALSEFESAAHNRALFPRFFRDPETGEAVSILDLAALLQQNGIRTLAARPCASTANASSPKCKLACFRSAGHIFALDIANVLRAIPAGENTATPIGSFFRTYWNVDNRQLPMLNLPRFLHLPGSAQPAAQRGLLVEHQGRQIGIEIDDVLGALEIPGSEISSVAHSGIPNAEVYGGLLRRGSDSMLVLDARALLQHEHIRNVTVAAHSCSANASETGEQQSFVVYESGRGTVASALRDIEGIIPLPQLASLGRPGAVFRGFLEWRAQSVSVLDLGAILGHPLPQLDASQSVLITRSSDELHGYVVPRVESLVMAVPQPVPPIARKDNPGLTHMIQLPGEGTRRNVSVLDLLTVQAPTARTAPDTASPSQTRS